MLLTHFTVWLYGSYRIIQRKVEQIADGIAFNYTFVMFIYENNVIYCIKVLFVDSFLVQT